jgi:ATP phosphoribosyltransferase
MLKIALPNKGRLSDDARSLLADAGLEVRTRGERALMASLGGEFEAIFLRAQDIPEFVADGVADAGITGWDLVVESGRDLASLLDLEFGGCTIVLAAREESRYNSLDEIVGAPRVATCFPRITKDFFTNAGRAVEVVPVSGAAEIAPHLGIAELIVDITSSGSTLRMNGMRKVLTILDSTARLITNATPPWGENDGKARAVSDLVAALTSVLRARGKRYLMANVKRDSLDDVRKVLPGLSGPTVIDILNGGSMVAVHAVVPVNTIYRTIADLKQLGAEGILVTRIERLMP